MPFDESLAARIREMLPPDGGFVAKRMFGGMAHLLHGNMCIGVWKDFVILRLGPDQAARALERDGVREFDVTGKPMKGWVMVDSAGLTDDALFGWLEQAVRFVSSLPAK